MAGGYPAYYYDYTAFDVIDFRLTPKGYGYFKILHDFFTSVDWWRLDPHPEIIIWHGRCLADIGKEYIFYIDGERIGVNINMEDEDFNAYWLNTFTGERFDLNNELWTKHHLSPTFYIFSCPFQDAPGILHLIVNRNK